MSTRAMWLLVLLAGCVDETGYEDTGDTRLGVGGFEDDGVSSNGLFYSADQPLGSKPVPVTVLGLPGLLPADTSAFLDVAGRTAPAPLVVSADGFVGVVAAALGDTVEVRVAGEVVHSVVLSQTLGDVEAPSDAASGGTGGGSPDVSTPVVVAGKVQVGVGAIAGVSVPYLAWVSAQHAVARVGASDADVTLPAKVGDGLCVASLDGTGKTSTSVCYQL